LDARTTPLATSDDGAFATAALFATVATAVLPTTAGRAKASVSDADSPRLSMPTLADSPAHTLETMVNVAAAVGTTDWRKRPVHNRQRRAMEFLLESKIDTRLGDCQKTMPNTARERAVTDCESLNWGSLALPSPAVY
jgi:hypothetical protein